MIKSDSTYYNSSSSSTGSECFSENSKSIDTVTQLFSNLLKNSESTTSLRCKSPSTVPAISNDNSNLSQSMSQECNTEENNRTDFISKDKTHDTSLQIQPSDNSESNTCDDQQKAITKSLAASSESVIIDKHKDFCTPFNSKIPVLHVKSDPSDFYQSDKKTPIGRKLLNASSLKKICSNSKIPVRSATKNYTHMYSQDKSPLDFLRNKTTRQTDQNKVPTKKNDYKNHTGKYNHVKSKLAAYIHRPSKMDTKYAYSSSNAKSNYKSSTDYKKTNEDNGYLYNTNSSNCLNIRRVESRTSLDTYVCDYKMPLPDFNCLDCNKSDDQPKNYQKAREHLEQAAEHCRIKSENRRIIEEHQRIIAKHQRIAMEHEEKANEHQLKAIACILNRVT